MLNKFALVAVILQIARAACTPGEASTNCKVGKCDVWISGAQYCSQCAKTNEFLVNGDCATDAGDSGCTAPSQADGTCTQCGAGYFLYEGGCYKVAESPGSFICSTQGDAGLCSACKNENGFFKNPSATVATHQSCIACNRTAAVDNVKGVEGCTACSGPDSAGSQGAPTVATCTKCDTTKYLKKVDDGTTTCVAEAQCDVSGNAYYKVSDSNKGNKCVSCSDAAGITDAAGETWKGVANCLTCTAPSAVNTPATCSGCTEGYEVNTAKTECIKTEPSPSACPIEGCKTCSADKKTCEECAENKYLTPTSQCINQCATIPGYYGATENGKRVCKKCGVANCETCNEQGKCSLCKDGFYGESCSKCHESCKNCGGATASDCTECPSGKALKYDATGNKGSCGDGCTPATGTEAGSCKTCDLTVGGTKYCSACNVATEYPQNGVCTSKTARATNGCKDGTVAGGVCKSCSDGFFLMDGGCYETGKYPGKSVCTSAPTGGTCTSLASGYYLNSGTLVTCGAGCAECTNSDSCTTCASGYVKLSGAATCTKCDAGCATCTTAASTCSTCADGYYKTASATGPCTSCESNSGDVKGVSGCASCAAPTGNSGTVLCYLMKDSTASNSDPNLSSGAIAGISVAVIAVVGGLVGFLCWWFVCRGKA